MAKNNKIMIFAPQWYKLLPDTVKPIDKETIKKVEDFRRKNNFNNEIIFRGIMVSRWTVERIQKFCLEEIKKQMPNASERELWKIVLLSRFKTKLIPLTDPFTTPLPREEILSRIENIDKVISNFSCFENVVDYIIKIDENEGVFNDPSGLQNELETILKK